MRLVYTREGVWWRSSKKFKLGVHVREHVLLAPYPERTSDFEPAQLECPTGVYLNP